MWNSYPSPWSAGCNTGRRYAGCGYAPAADRNRPGSRSPYHC